MKQQTRPAETRQRKPFLSAFARHVAVVASAGAVLVALVGVIGYRHSERQFVREQAKAHEAFAELFRQQLRERLDGLRIGLESLVMDEETIRLFDRRDRDALQRRLGSLFRDKLATDFDITQFHFHVPPATSFLRLHRPDRHGDDLSGWRDLVVQANRDRAPIAGLEVTRSGPGAKAILPVTVDGRHVGSVELATGITRLLARLGGSLGVQYAVGLDTAVWERANCSDLLTPLLAKDGLIFYEASGADALPALRTSSSASSIRLIEVDGSTLAMASFALVDHQGSRIGSVVTVKNVTAWIASLQERALVLAALVAVTVLLLAFVTGASAQGSFVRPIRASEAFVRAVSSGEYPAVQPDPNAGLNGLGTALREMASRLRDVARSTATMAEGDLSLIVEPHSRRDQLGSALKSLHSRMRSTRGESHVRATALATCSENLASAADAISRGSTDQLALIEEIRAALLELYGSDRAERGERRRLQRLITSGAARVRECQQALDDGDKTADSLVQLTTQVDQLAQASLRLGARAGREASRGGPSAATLAEVSQSVRKIADEALAASREARMRGFASASAWKRAREVIAGAADSLADAVQASTSQVTESAVDQTTQIDRSLGRIVDTARQIATMSRRVARTRRDISHVAAALDKGGQAAALPAAVVSKQPAPARPPGRPKAAPSPQSAPSKLGQRGP